MPKTFITERDIDDMKARGVTSIDVNDSVVLTDLALERAQRHGIKVVRAEISAPPRAVYSPSVNLQAAYPHETKAAAASASDAEIIARVRSAVLARLDGQVNPALLDAVIAKVVAAMK